MSSSAYMERIGRLENKIRDLREELKSHPQVVMWAITHRLKPTFYLHPDVHGITGEEHAKKIGADVLGMTDTEEAQYVTAVKVDIDD